MIYILSIMLRSFGFITPKDFKIIIICLDM
jgi:hypothetical protein